MRTRSISTPRTLLLIHSLIAEAADRASAPFDKSDWLGPPATVRVTSLWCRSETRKSRTSAVWSVAIATTTAVLLPADLVVMQYVHLSIGDQFLFGRPKSTSVIDGNFESAHSSEGGTGCEPAGQAKRAAEESPASDNKLNTFLFAGLLRSGGLWPILCVYALLTSLEYASTWRFDYNEVSRACDFPGLGDHLDGSRRAC